MTMRTGGLMVPLLLAAAAMGSEGERIKGEITKAPSNVSQCSVPDGIDGTWWAGAKGFFFDLRKAPECTLLVTILKEENVQMEPLRNDEDMLITKWKSPWNEEQWAKAERREKSYESAFVCRRDPFKLDQQGTHVICRGDVRYDHNKKQPWKSMSKLMKDKGKTNYNIEFIIDDNGGGPTLVYRDQRHGSNDMVKVRDRIKIPEESCLPDKFLGTWRPLNGEFGKQYVFDASFYKKSDDANACYIDVKVFKTYPEGGKPPKPKSPRSDLKCQQDLNDKELYKCEGFYQYKASSRGSASETTDLRLNFRGEGADATVSVLEKASSGNWVDMCRVGQEGCEQL